MSQRVMKIGIFTAAAAASAALAGCNVSVGAMSCDSIADHAKATSQNQQYKITALSNVHEVSRTAAETRCEGNATWSDSSNSQIYMRAYEEGGNRMVAYQNQPFQDGAGAAPAAPPPSGGVPGYDQPAANQQ